jgi:hypothetical protein
MARSAAVLAAIALATATTTAAGCGGGGGRSDAGARYADTVNAAQKEFRLQIRRLSSGIAATSTPAQGRRTLDRFQIAVDGAIRRLRAVRPPAGVQALHRELIAAIAAYGRPIAGARRSFASGDPRRVLTAQGELRGAVTDAGARVNRTIDEINAQLRDG